MKKTSFILAAVLSLATVSAMADSHKHRFHPQHRADRVTMIKHYHHNQAPHYRAGNRYSGQHYARPAPHYRHAPRHYAHRPMPHRTAPHAYYTPVRPAPLRYPSANFSLSVNL